MDTEQEQAVESVWLGHITSGDEQANKYLRECDAAIYTDRDTGESALVFGREAMQKNADGDETELKMLSVKINLAGGELPVLLREVVAAKGWHEYEAPQDGQN